MLKESRQMPVLDAARHHLGNTSYWGGIANTRFRDLPRCGGPQSPKSNSLTFGVDFV